MDKSFSIGKYLLSKTGNDRETEVRLRMLCVAMAKDMPEEKRKRYIRPFFTDMEFMNRIAGWMNELPEAITCGQREFADWLELFMMSAEAESTRYVIRLQAWYIHFCCVEELLTMCRLLQKLRLEHLDPIRNRMIHYFREARQLCGMPSLSRPAEGIEVSIRLLDASYDHISRNAVLQAEELLGNHTDHSFVEKVLECYTKARTTEELAELCGASSIVTFRRTFLRLFNCPVARWLRQKRAERVLKLLRTTHLPLPEIAEQCGFANQSYLSDFCKRNLGDIPVNIRKNRN